jgi:hypothetical protein
MCDSGKISRRRLKRQIPCQSRKKKRPFGISDASPIIRRKFVRNRFLDGITKKITDTSYTSDLNI